jgi:hypothetical protein
LPQGCEDMLEEGWLALCFFLRVFKTCNLRSTFFLLSDALPCRDLSHLIPFAICSCEELQLWRNA